MTLEEGIVHAEDVARMNHEAAKHLTDEHPTQAEKCEACAEEHQQLAEWLKELKTLKVSRKEFLNDIDMAIKAANMDDAYSVGMRNGMRVIKAFIDDEKPEYEKCCHEENKSEIPNTCGDAISRQAVFEQIAEWIISGEYGFTNATDYLSKKIKALPSVTPQQRTQQRTGRWIKQNYGWNWQCSECGFVTPPSAKEIFTFCPNCGAKMEVQDAESEAES